MRTLLKKFRETRRLYVKVSDEDNNCLNDSLIGPDALVPIPVKFRPKRKIKRKMKVQKVDENAIGIVDELVPAEEDTHASPEAEAPGFHGSSYSGLDVVVDGTEITVTHCGFLHLQRREGMDLPNLWKAIRQQT